MSKPTTSTNSKTSVAPSSTLMKTIEIKAFPWNIAADLHLPSDFNESQNKKYPTIISAHPIGSCKEQTSGNVYGKALAKEGFLVIAFDRRFQGASGGEPRSIEDPTMTIEDFRIVVDYLVTLNYVDAERIGVLGICGGGGYAINAAMTERRIKAVVSITGVNFGRLMREGFSQFNPIGALEAMAKQRTSEACGTVPRVDDLLPSSPAAAKAAGLKEIDLCEATEYYRTARGQAPHGLARVLFSHNAVAVGWDAFHLAEVLLTQPLILVVGDKVGAFGAYRDSCEIYGRAASKKKELVVVEGWSHYDLYDKPEPVGQALAKVIPFLKEHLSGESKA